MFFMQWWKIKLEFICEENCLVRICYRAHHTVHRLNCFVLDLSRLSLGLGLF